MQYAEKHAKVLALKKTGLKVVDACKQVGLSVATFYTYESRARKNKPSKRRSKLLVHDLPEAPKASPWGFIVYGPAETLAAFAKGYQ